MSYSIYYTGVGLRGYVGQFKIVDWQCDALVFDSFEAATAALLKRGYENSTFVRPGAATAYVCCNLSTPASRQ